MRLGICFLVEGENRMALQHSLAGLNFVHLQITSINRSLTHSTKYLAILNTSIEKSKNRLNECFSKRKLKRKMAISNFRNGDHE